MSNFSDVLYRLLGQKIKERRIELGLNQTQLSERIDNIGRTSISNIEKGKQQPPLHVIYHICNALNLDIHRIIPIYSKVVEEALRSNKNQTKRYIEESTYNDSEKFLIEKLIKKTEQ